VPSEQPLHDALSEFERWWETPVEFILFMFALTNAGVPINGAGTPTWIVLAALIAGKPAGIVAATWLAERFGFRRADGLTWKHVLVLGITAGSVSPSRCFSRRRPSRRVTRSTRPSWAPCSACRRGCSRWSPAE
jgi:hypothetical protein